MAIKNKKFAKSIQYRPLIRLMRSFPESSPPPDTTRQIMSRIQAVVTEHESSANRGRQRLLKDILHWQGPTRWPELSACLFAVVFSYIILGAILYFGLQLPDGRSAVPFWIKVQVPYALVTATGLLFVGLYTLKRDWRSVRLARSVITIHLGVTTVFIIMMLIRTDDAALLGGLLSLMSVHLIHGIFMALAVHRFHNFVCNDMSQDYCAS